MKNLVKATPLLIAPLWLARLGIGLVACLLTMSMEWLRPGFVVSLDEAFAIPPCNCRLSLNRKTGLWWLTSTK